MAYVKSTYHSVIGKKDLLWKQMDKYIFPKIKTYFQSAIWHFISGKEKRKKSNVKQKNKNKKQMSKAKAWRHGSQVVLLCPEPQHHIETY